MSTYVATFYTHLSAQLSSKRLRGAGYEARMMPVPRALSSSCGTCVTKCPKKVIHWVDGQPAVAGEPA